MPAEAKEKHAATQEARKGRARQGSLVLYAVAAIAIIAIVAGSVYYFTAGSLSVQNGDNVSLYYTGRLQNGTIFGSNVGGQPLVFTVGANQVIPGFNNGIMGMHVNQTRQLVIPPNQAYGEINSSLIITVPIAEFGNHTVKVGEGIGQTLPNGGQLQGVITAINSTNAIIDFNPPLAGRTLIFNVTIVSIRKG